MGALISFDLERRIRDRRRGDMGRADLAVEAHAAVEHNRRTMHTAFRLIHGGSVAGATAVLATGIEGTFVQDDTLRRLAGPEADWNGAA